MKADYNSLLYAYESNRLEILDIMGDDVSIATEAQAASEELDASKAVSDTVKSDESKAISNTVLINKVIERVRNLIKKIGSIFEQLSRKLSNRLRIMSQTDKGFTSLYRKRKAMVKPYKSVQVISYQYHNEVLDRPIQKLMDETVECLDKLRAVKGTVNGSSRISEIINASQGKIIEVLVSPYVKDSDIPVTTMDAFIKYLVQNYRGEKKEIVYRDTQLADIERSALSSQEIANISNQYLNKAREAYNKLKSLEHQISRTSTDNEVTKMVASNAAKAAVLYNAFSALIHAYYELKLEQTLNYRIILKKFYQF